MNQAEIIYFGNKAIVKCDAKCNKAWGINSRPRNSDDSIISDDLLNKAPLNPGTYEGGHGKPLTSNNFPNKWCVRECERSVLEDKNDY